MSRKTDMLTLDIIVVTNTIQVLLVASDAAKCCGYCGLLALH